jgi:simple sugar transport system ATP-binding protein
MGAEGATIGDVTDETGATGGAVPLMELRGVSKTFGRVRALSDISIGLFPGEVVSLVGDNGAGKSTLTKVISGAYTPDPGGEIWIDGVQQRRWNSRRSRASGVETVYQSRALAEQQSISDNVFMGRERTYGLGFINRAVQRRETEQLMRSIGYTSKVWTPDSKVSKLSGGERQGVAIARAMHFNGRLVILDEPTTAMALSEVQEVIRFIQRLKDLGTSVLFISHNPWDAHRVADRFLLMDRGAVVGDEPKDDMSAQDLIERLHHMAKKNKGDQ